MQIPVLNIMPSSYTWIPHNKYTLSKQIRKKLLIPDSI